ncbi:MAG: DUF4920 domain-containing protein [Hymenobacteraceae bacterium]|nr:DUF4920 domain-containing protein [Hymenobacteraceae bacterium]MDX5396777.1 DUF4920 domain-containing protein [Hymenobacteraceae bacterium]MDX5512840.1 DUF4920 domain-containing protein [Hymenobacteraceae bacterium]
MNYRFLLIASAFAVFTACNNAEETTGTETVETTEATAEETNKFGEEITTDNAITVAQLEETMKDKDSAQVKVRAEIIESCQNKGCWVDVKLADGTPMKVTFKDYGFFVPIKDLSGKEVVMEGVAKREMVSVEDQQHYAKDALISDEEFAKITEPKESLVFVANGVVLEE